MKKPTVKIFLRVRGRIYRSTNPKSFYARFLAVDSRKFSSFTEFPHVYLRISYGKKKDNHGKMVEFYNDYEGNNKQEFIKAYRAFTEDV